MKDLFLQIITKSSAEEAAEQIAAIFKTNIIDAFDIGQANWEEGKRDVNDGNEYYKTIENEDLSTVIDFKGELKINHRHKDY